MSIGMVEFQGAIQRTQDFSTIKQQEDGKAMVSQSSLLQKEEKEQQVKPTQVRQMDQTDKNDTHADAREQGKNQYFGDGGMHRKKDAPDKDGKVSIKGVHHFDVSI